MFDNATKVPLIITVPGFQDEVVINNSPVELIDIYPTLMDLTKINKPNHVIGKSLYPIINKKTEYVRDNALTRWENGYSLKTNRFRITQWGENGILGYELYDHKIDPQELKNLAKDSKHLLILDSLKTILSQRIINAEIKPNGLGKQIQNVQPMARQKSITPGDIYDKNGKRTYLKPSGTIKQ